jgi:radical SAM superfamily enzyme YgiQ (UPF0313 family)
MNDILFITFDVKRDDYPSMSYSIASLFAALNKVNIHPAHFSLDLQHALEEIHIDSGLTDTVRDKLTQNLPYFKKFNFIAIGVTAWSHDYCILILEMLNDFKGKIILGGYEITSTPYSHLEILFPRADYFIKGYAERSLKKIVLQGNTPDTKVLSDQVCQEDLISPYLTGVINLNTRKIHWETKRGCMFRCGFCEWGNFINKVVPIENERLFREIELFSKSSIGEINILDGTFNVGREYLKIFRKLIEIPELHITCQARFESLYGIKATEFIKLCSENRERVHLEFGLQTIHENEMLTIGRKNNIQKIKEALRKLNENNIDYETSIIYAIPGQTVESFIDTIEFLIENGCKVIKAYPLQIPKNSELEYKRMEYGVKESKDKYNVKSVNSTMSFSKEERKDMDRIVQRLHAGEINTDKSNCVDRNEFEKSVTFREVTPFQRELVSWRPNLNNPELFARITNDFINPTKAEIGSEDAIQLLMITGELFQKNYSKESQLKFMAEILNGKYYFELRKFPNRPDELDMGMQKPIKIRLNPDLIPKRYYCKVRLSKSNNIYILRDIQKVG